ncbi:hypothetical protein MJO29_014312 [Puccinia striiformis f. sp. tritici]|nr:hypothetical protein MJO29_014312 [Puccinia striiformis f. sp. tritici]
MATGVPFGRQCLTQTVSHNADPSSAWRGVRQSSLADSVSILRGRIDRQPSGATSARFGPAQGDHNELPLPLSLHNVATLALGSSQTSFSVVSSSCLSQTEKTAERADPTSRKMSELSHAPAKLGNPLPENGLVTRLTSSQYQALKSFWRELFRLVDNAPEQGSSSSTRQDPPHSDSTDHSQTDFGKDAPAFNHQKDKARAEQELADVKLGLEKYGSIKFMDTFWNMVGSHDPDVVVLKFLRARKWNVLAGVAMIAACLKWRIEYGVDDITYDGEEGHRKVEGFLHQYQIGKTFVQGTDRQGRPVVYINVRLHKGSDQSPKVLEDFIVFCMESTKLMLTPPLVEKATIIMDLSGFGLANMDWRSLGFIVKCLESYYPESLNALIVHNAPWVFQGLWKIIGPMIDPVVRAKIQMTKTAEDLKVHIDEKHLLESLGGTNQWKWEYDPIAKGENALMNDRATVNQEIKNRKKLIKAHLEITRKWAEEASSADLIRDDDVIIPEDLSVSAQIRKFIFYHIRVHSFVLDPYIRGRTIYDRKGRVLDNGLVTFEYPTTESKAKNATLLLEKEIQEVGDHWEVLGQSMSRENLLLDIEVMKVAFMKNEVDFPLF